MALAPDGTWIDWIPPAPVPERLLHLVEVGHPLAAHNAWAFDRHVWAAAGLPEPVEWIDTLPLARLAALPGRLDEIGLWLYGRGKDDAGQKALAKAIRVDKHGRLPLLTPDQLELIVEYCRRDVELLAQIWHDELRQFVGVEPNVIAADQAVNDRGFRLDRQLAEGVIWLAGEVERRTEEAAPVDGTTLRSPLKLKRWLAAEGVEVENVQRCTLLSLLDGADVELTDELLSVVTARLSASAIAKKKLVRALDCLCDDGRIRDSLAYHSAHTGRWGGRGLQPQNLPRGLDCKRLSRQQLERAIACATTRDADAFMGLLEEVRCTADDLLASLIRPCITAPGKALVVADFRQIEARALLWEAGDAEGLRSFATDDPYKAVAAKLFTVRLEEVADQQRQLGKVLTLGAGYGMGAERFRGYGEANGIDWSTAPLAPTQCIETWRDANPLIAGVSVGRGRRCGLWQDVGEAVQRVLRTGGECRIARCTWRCRNESLDVELPSGRVLRYREARCDHVLTQWENRDWQLSYRRRINYRHKMWGGEFVQNITQAICRDLLADVLVRCEAAGLEVVLHVHDELVLEAEKERVAEVKAALEQLMTTPPAWASGLPIAVEIKATERYCK